jgi:hypothetical protein
LSSLVKIGKYCMLITPRKISGWFSLIGRI